MPFQGADVSLEVLRGTHLCNPCGVMTVLYLPPSARYFEPMRVLPNARREYMSLEYDLVEALRPKLVVDLGAGDAQTYFTLCQSVRDHDVDALCYAVDEWADDDGKPEHDESRHQFVNHFAHNEMRGIAYLLQMDAAAASVHFGPGMIDLLRIDARRFAQPVEEIAKIWVRYVAPGGVVMCPGTKDPVGASVRDIVAGQASGRWDLEAGQGLALFRFGEPGSSEAELLNMAFSRSDAERTALARWYAHLHEHHGIRAAVRTARWGLGVKKNPRKQ